MLSTTRGILFLRKPLLCPKGERSPRGVSVTLDLALQSWSIIEFCVNKR